MASPLLRAATDFAESRYGVVSPVELDELGVGKALRDKWVERGHLRRAGLRSFVVPGAPTSWRQRLALGLADLGPDAAIDGRSAARLHRLDSFDRDAAEFIVPLRNKGRSTSVGVSRTSRRARSEAQMMVVDGLRCVRPHQLILDAPIFAFSVAEIENAIDSAVRLRLVSVPRLRDDVLLHHSQGRRGGRALLDAVVDLGGESRLERRLIELIRRAGLPRPELQKRFASEGRTFARVDLVFGDHLIVEAEGHQFHSSRRQRQADEERRTRLTLQGHTVIVFTFNDVRDRPGWVADRIRDGLALTAAA